MTSVLVSYSQHQAEWVQKRLLPVLKAGGANLVPKLTYNEVYNDRGKSITELIGERVDGDNIIIVILSEEYWKNPDCLVEWTRALKRNEGSSNGINIIPITREECRSPNELTHSILPCVNLIDDGVEDQWGRLLAECEISLRTKVIDWLDALEEMVLLLGQRRSVNLVASDPVKWHALIEAVDERLNAGMRILDLSHQSVESSLSRTIAWANEIRENIKNNNKKELYLGNVTNHSKPLYGAMIHIDEFFDNGGSKSFIFELISNYTTYKKKSIFKRYQPELSLLLHSREPLSVLLSKDELGKIFELSNIVLKPSSNHIPLNFSDGMAADVSVNPLSSLSERSDEGPSETHVPTMLSSGSNINSRAMLRREGGTRYILKLCDLSVSEELAAKLTDSSSIPFFSKMMPWFGSAHLFPEEVEKLMPKLGVVLYPNVEFGYAMEGSDETGWIRDCEFDRDVGNLTHAELQLRNTGCQADVLDLIKAPAAWDTSTGAGVTIAIIDKGICAKTPGLPKHKRSSVDLANGFEGRHWESEDGHGSMCAGIAAGTSRDGGRYNGVAPDAQVLAARCDLTMDGIIRTYECLLRMRAEGKILGPLVISNSFSPKGCAPSQNADDQHPLIEFVRLAVNMLRIPVIFSAGNNHRHCGHDPRSHEPSTIWGVNSIDEVLTIGAVAHDGSNQKPDFPHSHSSRGPGELHRSHPKPDCVAPTFGEVVYGDDYRRMSWWGTSGAAPQAAGLAALLLSKNSSFLPSEVADLIRNTATPLNFHPFCVGRGLINCAEAIASL